jgi:membrane-anchored mycosin MYCP
VVLAAALGGAGLAVPIAPAYAEAGPCEEIQEDTTDTDPVTTPSAPLEELRITEATQLLERRGVEPGQGIGVAVVDSGVDDDAPVNEVGELPTNPQFTKTNASVYYHGTAVAGLISGAERPDGDGEVGIAPAASIYDVRVYDAREDDDNGEYLGLTDAGVIDGLNRIADDVRPGPDRIRIVNVSLALQPSAALEHAVKRLAAKGVVVVAASGNRPLDEGDAVLGDFAGEAEPGEDAARAVFPAGYESVVAVTSSVPRGVDARDFVLQSSATDIAVPTIDAVSYAVNGQSCLLPPDAATSWAAAEVSGILALLMSAYDEPPGRTVARLLRTATGAGDVTTRLTGHGVAQPVEALQRPVTFEKGGAPETSETNNTVLKARAPRPEADVLEETRRDAVWWGLAGGGALVIALLLRPVLVRRRTER